MATATVLNDHPVAGVSILQKDDFHRPLLREVERITREANIPRSMLHTSMTQYCSEIEVGYIRQLKKLASQGVFGFAYVGAKMSAPVPQRMMAMAAACLRNYISARLMNLQDVISALRTDAMPDVRLLLIPNFHLSRSDRKPLPEWQASMLSGMLYNRQAAEQQTVVYVHDLEDLAVKYGMPFRQHIENHFRLIDS